MKAANCPKLDQKTRQGLLDTWKTMAEAWGSIDMKNLPAAKAVFKLLESEIPKSKLIAAYREKLRVDPE